MLQNPCHRVLLVVLCFWIIETTGIIFSNSHLKQTEIKVMKKWSYKRIEDLLCCSKNLQFMSSSENLSCWCIVVIAEVIGNESTGSHKVIVLIQKKTGPWKLSRTCLSVSQARDWSVVVPCPTLLGSLWLGLLTSLGPGYILLSLLWVQTGLAKNRKVNVCIITASLLSNWTRLLRLISRWSVDYSGGYAWFSGCCGFLTSIDKP